MIKRLQLKFIAIMMGVLLLVFAVIFLTLNIFMRVSSNRQIEQLLEMVAAADGEPAPRGQTELEAPAAPNDGPPATQPQYRPGDSAAFTPPARHEPGDLLRAGRYFWLKYDETGALLDWRVDLLPDFTRAEAEAYAEAVLGRNSESGVLDDFQYLVCAKDYGQIVVFAERSVETKMLAQLMRVSIGVAVASGLVLLVFAVFLSRWAVKPVKQAFERQRRFVADASHELKTPLTIIAANAEVLQNERGAHPRLDQIKQQTERMSRLVNDLLALAKTDEGQGLLTGEFDLSQAILNTTLEFESRAFEEGRLLQYEIAENVRYTGDEARLREVAAILIDNALRHSPPGARVLVRLQQENNGKIRFSVYNSGAGVPEAERSKIFQRFYRSDSSRSRDTGGFGLGLAIAKAIAEAHQGKIGVSGEQGEGVQFDVVL